MAAPSLLPTFRSFAGVTVTVHTHVCALRAAMRFS
jgi:hypothetical protein